MGVIHRNQLIKCYKVTAADGPFKAINVILTHEFLQQYAKEYHVYVLKESKNKCYDEITPNPFLIGYFNSLLPYFDEPEALNELLADLKTKEGMELILKFHPELKNILFDFSSPHKINLESYMNRNFMFNVPLTKFAELTGRSLSAFKRDFRKVYGIPPQKWLNIKRLDEAHYLIKEKGRKPSQIFKEAGFQNLSHFSYLFKKHYGYSPSDFSKKVAD
jgi:AraC-like DNA-binding protein